METKTNIMNKCCKKEILRIKLFIADCISNNHRKEMDDLIEWIESSKLSINEVSLRDGDGYNIDCGDGL